MFADTVQITQDSTSTRKFESAPIYSDLNVSNFDENLGNIIGFLKAVSTVTNKYKISYDEPAEAFLTMLASEDVLRKEWDQPEEDEAWADL